jgi:hypothetical protein
MPATLCSHARSELLQAQRTFSRACPRGARRDTCGGRALVRGLPTEQIECTVQRSIINKYPNCMAHVDTWSRVLTAEEQQRQTRSADQLRRQHVFAAWATASTVGHGPDHWPSRPGSCSHGGAVALQCCYILQPCPQICRRFAATICNHSLQSPATIVADCGPDGPNVADATVKRNTGFGCWLDCPHCC